MSRHKQVTADSSPEASSARLYEWLPEDDEANRLRYYVPTPQEIKRHCEAIHRRDRRQGHHLKSQSVLTVPVRRRAFDGEHLRGY